MIELSQVSLSRGRAEILSGAFLRIDVSQVVLISGPSGIGKTSLLSLIGGFLHADAGTVRVFDREVARLRATSTALLRRKLAFVPQELELIDADSALANVRLALEVCGIGRKEAAARAAQALSAVDLADHLDVRVARMSTGQRRRVSLARGLVRSGDVFVADEPTNDLDAGRVLQFVELIEDMRERGTAVVMATNDPRLLAHSCQTGWRHLAIAAGQLVPGDLHSLHAPPVAEPEAIPENVVPFPIQAAASGDMT